MNTRLKSVLEIFDLLSDISSLRKAVAKLEERRTEITCLINKLEKEHDEVEEKKHKADSDLIKVKIELLKAQEAGEAIYESMNETLVTLANSKATTPLIEGIKEALKKAEQFNTVPF